MKKIITCGLRYSDFARQRDLFALRNNKDVEIVGEILFEANDEEIFFCRKTVEEALDNSFDFIMLCGMEKETALAAIKSFDREVDADLLVDLENFIKPYHKEMGEQQIRILKELVQATEEEIHSKEWMQKRIFEYGIFPYFKMAKEPQKGVVWSTCGILQVPDEFLEYCLYLSTLKCESAIEVGVARGGSSYVMAALLYRNNSNMTYHMVDIEDGLVHFEEAKSIIPSLEKNIPCTSDDFKGQSFDFCFIDADHSYEGIMTDWENVGKYTKKCLTFHDIYAHEYDEFNGGTVRGWKEIKDLNSEDKQMVISKYPDKWMGIGVIKMDK